MEHHKVMSNFQTSLSQDLEELYLSGGEAKS